MNDKPVHNISQMRNVKSALKKLVTNQYNATIFLYGLVLAVFIGVLKFFEYRYFIRKLSIEVYVGVIALAFTALGIWVGLKLINRKKNTADTLEVQNNENLIKDLGISAREYEVLELIVSGFSNKEIAEKLFISLPTVKTHTSNLFVKLDVKRRTQAIHKAKKLNIIS